MRSAEGADRADKINSDSDLWGRRLAIACRQLWEFRATRARGTRAARREECGSLRTAEITGTRYLTANRWRRSARWQLRLRIQIRFGRERAKAGPFAIAMWRATEFI